MSRSRLAFALSCAVIVAGGSADRASAFNPGTVCHPLQDQIDVALSGSTIEITTPQVNCHVSTQDKDLTFHGSGNGGFTGSDGDYPDITAQGGGKVVISNLTFRNASSSSGGGGALEFTNTVAARVTHSRFYGNHSSNAGGAIQVNTTSSDPVVIEDSTFGSSAPGQGNTAYTGGAVAIFVSAPVTLARNTFVGNSDEQSGGALFLTADAGFPVSITDTKFIGNRAVTGGGGASLQINGSLSLTRTRFEGNKSLETASTSDRRMGGGLSAAADGGVTQSDNVFKNNVLSYNMPVPVFDSGGGGEWVNPGTQLTSRRDRFVGNSTTNTNAMGPETGGGALYVLGCASSPPTARLEDLVAAGNHVGTPGDGSGVYDGCPSQPVTLRVSDSTIAANTGGGQIDGGDTDHLQMQNSIIAPALGTPAINGFATRAVSFSDTCRASGPKLSGAGNICADPRLKNAGAGDIHQTSKSPTRDRGSNALVPSGLSTDFEGGKRITDYQPDGKAIVDMGADETLTGTLIVRGLHVGRLRLTGKHRGTRITYSITGPARVTYTFTRLLPHRKTRGAGSFAKNAGKAGKQSVRFSGRVGHHTLAPGSYKLTVTAKNRLNNRSRKTTTKFAVVSR